MGKNEEQSLQEGEQSVAVGNEGQSLCPGCSLELAKISRCFSFKCVLVLILSLSVLVSGFFWILPFHSGMSGFDANRAVWRSATVQASFYVQKPVSDLVPHIEMLEYDIYEEIAVPDTKVAILSMHQSSSPNWTRVVFGVLSNTINVPINPVSLSMLRSSLIVLFFRHSNLTLTRSVFGEPSNFEILKCPGGITVNPSQSPSIWISQSLFNFTLYNSISEIQDNFIELEDQLKYGLRLKSDENLFVQVTNGIGSTISHPVIVQASVISDLGNLLPPRLKQLAQTIKDPPAKNLGLDNSVFGKVKSVSLSSYLQGTLHAPPTPPPAPSPMPSISPRPAHSPTHSPEPSPVHHHHHHHRYHRHHRPCINCQAAPPTDHGRQYAPNPKSSPSFSFAPTLSHTSPSVNANSPCPYTHRRVAPRSSPKSHSSQIHHVPTMGRRPVFSPDLSPIPAVSYSSHPSQSTGDANDPDSPVQEPSSSPFSPSSSAVGALAKEAWLAGVSGLLIFHLLCRVC